MDIELAKEAKDLEAQLRDLGFERSKTSMRLHYEAQARVIKNQIGNLESVRTELGLSQRKMAQMLMVDPSAWTRWTRLGDDAPPHIWRALQWYMIVKEKIPGLTPQYFIGQDSRVLHQKAMQKIEEESQQRQQWVENLSQGIETQEFLLQKESQNLKDQILYLNKTMQMQKRYLVLSMIFSFVSFSTLLYVLLK